MLQTYSVGKMRWRGSSDQEKYRRAKPGQVLFGAGTITRRVNLMLHTYVEEKLELDVAAHRLGQVEAYLTVREVLSEASTAADGVLLRERSGFYRCR